MVLTSHAIVGAALANMFPNEPILGFGLAFASHFVLDMIPHHQYFYDIPDFIDKETKTIRSIFKHTGAALHLLFVVIDLIAVVVLCTLFFVRDEKSAMITLIGVAGGLLPDILSVVFYKYQIFSSYIKKHAEIQNHPKGYESDKLWDMLLQFVVPFIILVIYFLVKI